MYAQIPTKQIYTALLTAKTCVLTILWRSESVSQNGSGGLKGRGRVPVKVQDVPDQDFVEAFVEVRSTCAKMWLM